MLLIGGVLAGCNKHERETTPSITLSNGETKKASPGAVSATPTFTEEGVQGRDEDPKQSDGSATLAAPVTKLAVPDLVRLSINDRRHSLQADHMNGAEQPARCDVFENTKRLLRYETQSRTSMFREQVRGEIEKASTKEIDG